MTNPVFFEDPRTLTEARVIYLHHKVPLTALGGEVDLIAVQLRAAINDRLSIIATKDGYATSDNPLIDDGWADVSVGLKYNLYADPCSQRLLSGGVVYEMPVGSTRTQQGNGDGLFNVFLTGGAEFGNNNHLVSAAGFLLPADRAAESSMFFWSNHVDRRIGCSNFYALAEVNWYHYMGAGRAFNVAPIEGGDLFNFGTVGVAGNDIVTGAIGVKYKPRERIELGVAWEAPADQTPRRARQPPHGLTSSSDTSPPLRSSNLQERLRSPDAPGERRFFSCSCQHDRRHNPLLSYSSGRCYQDEKARSLVALQHRDHPPRRRRLANDLSRWKSDLDVNRPVVFAQSKMGRQRILIAAIAGLNFANLS